MDIRLLLALLIAGTSLPTLAQDETEAPFDWTGFYAGIHGGGGWGHSHVTDSSYNGGIPFFPTFSFDVESNGLLVGLQGGHNWQTGSVVFGVEGELGYLNLNGKAFPPFQDPYGFDYDSAGTVSGGWYGGLSARLGAAAGNSLLYVKGGGVYSGATVGYVDECIIFPCGPGLVDGSEPVGLGYQIGAGVEHAITEDWTLEFDYTYVDFGSARITGVGGASTAGQTFQIESGLSAHLIKIGANHRF